MAQVDDPTTIIPHPPAPRRSPRLSTPRTWIHDSLHMFDWQGQPSGLLHCWCKCPKCWNKYAQRCICPDCPCVVERDRAVLAMVRVYKGPGRPRPAQPIDPDLTPAPPPERRRARSSAKHAAPGHTRKR